MGGNTNAPPRYPYPGNASALRASWGHMINLTLFNTIYPYLTLFTLFNFTHTEFDQLRRFVANFVFIKNYALFRVKFTSLKSWQCKTNDIKNVWGECSMYFSSQQARWAEAG